MRAVIDIGTNSVRLLIAELGHEADGKRYRAVKRETRITRLGQGVNQSGLLSTEAIDRTCDALRFFCSIIAEYDVESVVVLATSATRDAKNKDQFLKIVKETTGLSVKVITGEKEAKLSYLGATKSVRSQKGINDHLFVLDIGGGSTELILGTRDGFVLDCGSVQAGAVRMTELFVDSHPIPKRTQLAMEQEIKNRLEPTLLPMAGKAKSLVAVGGTATTVGALHLKLKEYSEDAVTGLSIKRGDVAEIYHSLAGMSLTERMALPGMQKGREDVIPAGVAILLTVMNMLEIENIIISDADLLYGELYI